MSRFANPEATSRFPLGPCDCPGTPHAEGDWLALRSELGAHDLVFLEETTDAYERMKFLVRDWNLIGDDGRVAPVNEDYLRRLYVDLFPAINAWLTENAKTTTLPNASAAPSRDTSRGSGSRTPKARMDGSSTTPFSQVVVPSATSGSPPPTS